MATLGKIKIDTRGGVNPAQWKIFLGAHDISHLVAGVSIITAPNMPLPVVNLTLLGQVELPRELTAILQATVLPTETNDDGRTTDADRPQTADGANEGESEGVHPSSFIPHPLQT